MLARVVLITCPNLETAKTIGNELVRLKLAACANILPSVTSIYHWEGKIRCDDEVLLVLKSVESKVKELEGKVHELHPYDTPEFVVLKPEHVAEKYLGWLEGYLN